MILFVGGPRLGLVAETGRFVAMETRLEYDFLACFCALLPTLRFSFLSFLICFPFISVCLSSSCPFVCAAAICYSAGTYFIVRVLSACVICTLPHLGILLFFYLSSIYIYFSFLGWRFLLLCSRPRYAST